MLYEVLALQTLQKVYPQPDGHLEYEASYRSIMYRNNPQHFPLNGRPQDIVVLLVYGIF